MKKWMRLATVLVAGSHMLVGASAVLAQEAGKVDERTVDLGREAIALAQSGFSAKLWERFDATMRQAIGSEEALKGVLASIGSQLGQPGQRLSERIERVQGQRVYVALYEYEKVDAPVVATVAFTAEDRVSGLWLRPQPTPAPTEHLDYLTRTQLRLPFDGEWYVFWGGRSPQQNYHVISADQRFAYDFVIRRNGRSYEGDGSSNSDYFCFGEPILAPGSGIVLKVVNGIPDNRPGVMNPAQPSGNTVVIDHGEGEYSVLAHFQNGSLTVQENDTVAAGQQLGLCGNSGNSSEPHLHYHLQDGPGILAGAGLPAYFIDYIADGTPVERGEPTRGQHIRKR